MTDLLQVEADQPILDENKEYFPELVGEGKKYKDQEALAKSKVHGDATIEIYKRRLDELTDYSKQLREENITKAKLEELYDKLASQSDGSKHTPSEQNNQPQINPQDIEKMISDKMAQVKTADKEQANLNIVKEKLTERFGPKYQDVVKQKIDTLGLSPADFHLLAKNSPHALFKTLELDNQITEQYQAPLRSSQRNDNFAPTGAVKRTWAYWQEQKKKNPQLYYDRATAVQMSKDAVELGEAFRDGDYYRKGLHDE